MPVQLIILIAILSLIILLVSLYTVRKRPATKKLPTTELPPSSFITINSLDSSFKIRYITEGNGPELVLIHGIGASVYTWRHSFNTLAKKFKVTAFDLPGFGESEKDESLSYDLDSQCKRVIDILDHLKIKQCHIIGSSMGGTIALWVAKTSPKRVKKLILLAPATNKKIVPINPQKLSIAAPALSKCLHEQIMRSILVRVNANKELICTESINQYAKPYRNHPEAIICFLKSIQLLTDPRLPKELSSVQHKSLILYGEKDQMVNKRYTQQLVNILPNAQLISHQSAGHHLMEDEPLWFQMQVQDFVL